MKRDLKFTRIYKHPPERVWRALTDREAIGEWLMQNDFEPRVGHTFQFRTDPAPGFDGIVNCEVLALEPPKRLAYSWKGGPINTIVTFTLEPIAEGTRLTVEHTGFAGLKAVLISYIMQSGWGGKILGERLVAILDRMAKDGESFTAREGDDCHAEGGHSASTQVIGHLANLVPGRDDETKTSSS